jgi:hypothetical protein
MPLIILNFDLRVRPSDPLRLMLAGARIAPFESAAQAAGMKVRFIPKGSTPQVPVTSVERAAMSKKISIKWRSEPQKHDYPAAEAYLSLTLGQQDAKNAAKELQLAEMTEFHAKDIFRASMLSLLGVSNSHVEKDRTKIILQEKLSPLLLFRDERNGKLVIADGYHRLCAVYTFDEDALIPCKIV